MGSKAGPTHARRVARCASAKLVGFASLITIALAATALPATASATPAAGPVTFTVTSVGDNVDKKIDGVCATSVGTCSLRAAIQEANSASSATSVAINFAISGTGVRRIAPVNSLPPLQNATAPITIDGYTQAGSSANTDPVNDNAIRLIEIAGPGPASGRDGIVMRTSNNVLRGVVIHGFRHTVWMYDSAANNVVVGNLIGLLPTGDYDPKFALVNGSSCVVIQGGAHDNHVGAPGVASRNVISGCAHEGVAFYDGYTTRNWVQNNIVGLDPTGTQDRGSKSHGIDINTATTYTMVGGPNPGEGNVVSGNVQTGVEISHGVNTSHNSVIGNLIGTDPTGFFATPATRNGQFGVNLEGKPDCASLPCPLDEGFETVTDNVIVNSGVGGIMIHKGTHDSLIARNRIGVTTSGGASGNSLFGIRIEAGATRITVGPANEIAFNTGAIQIQAIGTQPPNTTHSPTHYNKITRNSIHDNVNNLGIDLAPFGVVNLAGNGDPDVNEQVGVPVLTAVTPTSATATTCANCKVELFVATRPKGTYGSGGSYIATGTADALGVAKIVFALGNSGKVVTATATTPSRSTSEFAKNVLVP